MAHPARTGFLASPTAFLMGMAFINWLGFASRTSLPSRAIRSAITCRAEER